MSSVPSTTPGHSQEPGEERFEQLEERLQRIETLLIKQQMLFEQVPLTLATATDTVDEVIGRLAARGVDVDARSKKVLHLVEKITDPEVLDALERLVSDPEQMHSALDAAESLPSMLSMAVDTFDSAVERLTASGIEPEEALSNLTDALRRFISLLQSAEFSALMHSGVLDPETLEVIGKVGAALRETRAEDTGRVGLWGMLRAPSRPHVQRTIDFGMRFAEHLGALLKRSPKQLEDK